MSDEGRTAPTAERLAKVIARSGRCSRRDAEDWIRAGRVSVNGTVIRTPAFNVTAKDLVRIDGQPLAARSGTRLWLYHKPAGLVVTEKDPEGRPTIFDKLAEAGLPRVLTVGRLDLNTEGLLLLTNDGGLKRVLELPATGWLRRYRVRAFGSVTQAQLDGLQQGVEIEGVKYGPIEAQLERQQGSNVWLVVSLREGKNREVKNVLANLGLQVNRLIRVSYGPFQLGDLPVGAVDVVKSRVLRDQLGTKLAAAAGADFESDVPDAAPTREVRRAPAGPRRPPGRPDERSRDAPAKPAGRPRRIFFDDGRPPEEYVPKPEPVGRNRPAAEAGRPATRTGRAERSPRPAGDRPRGPRPDGDRKELPRAARDRPRPPRAAGDRPRSPRSPDDRPRTPRPEGERPRGPRPPSRPEGTRPHPSRPGGKPEPRERPAPRSGPRTERPARAPRADGPARGQRADRPARTPHADRAGKPRSGAPGRPRPPGRPARPSGGPSRPRPGGPGKPPRKPRS